MKDRRDGDVDIVSISNEGDAANEHVTSPDITGDGRFVVFETDATNLVPQPTVSWQIYLHDRQTGVTELISRDEQGAAANRSSTAPTVSDDGRFVAYQSYATNLVAGTGSNRIHVYLFDRETGETQLISRNLTGAPANADSKGPVITPDGRWIAYHGHATDLVDAADGPGHDVFVYDRQTGQTDLVSVRSDGGAQDKGADSQTISADGRFVAFDSTARNLAPSNAWDTFHIYVHDRKTGETERVSVSSDGAEGDGASQDPMISGNGRFVTYASYAFNLTPEEELNRRPDIFVYDRVTKATELITTAVDGGAADSDAGSPSISHDGSVVAYDSISRNAVENDTNARRDVFVRERGPATGVRTFALTRDPHTASVSGEATFSGTMLAEVAIEPNEALEEGDAALEAGRIIYRTEREDLLFEMDLTALSAEKPVTTDRGRVYGASRTPVIYGWTFQAAGSAWEIRAQRHALTGAPDALPTDQGMRLFRCDGACVPEASLKGGIGTTGASVRIGLPLSALSLHLGGSVMRISAFVAPGDLTGPRGAPIAELGLPAVDVPQPRIDLGVAPHGAPSDDARFVRQPYPTEGRFTGSTDLRSLGWGHHTLWIRACVGDRCGLASEFLEGRPKPTTTLAFTDASTNDVQYSDRAAFEVRLLTDDGAPVPDQPVTFTLHGDGGPRTFSAATNADGTAAVGVDASDRPGAYEVDASFDGTPDLEPSAASTTLTVAKEGTELSLKIVKRKGKKWAHATLSDPDGMAGDLSGRRIRFLLAKKQVGSRLTTASGVAKFRLSKRTANPRKLRAVFSGDVYYLRSAARPA